MFYKLKVHPDAKGNRIVKKGPDAFELWVKAPAKRDLANAAAIGLLAGPFPGEFTHRRTPPSGFPYAEIRTDPKRILLVKGAHSPAKIVKVI